MLTLALVVSIVASPAPTTAQDAPRSIAAIGDSISRATNVCCWYGDHPSYSWSTGFNPFDGLHSHYERLLGLEPAVWGDEYNDARAGANMADATAQAEAAVSQGASYVTILMGANDVCASSVSTMTAVADFRKSFESAMGTLESGSPDTTKIFVASIPNVRRLWTLFHNNSTARHVWRTFAVCPSMLSESNTLDDRRHVYQRTFRLNAVLHDVCAEYVNCRFDGYAVFNYAFASNEVSRLDYFHPNRNGQNALADLTWTASWWG
jgi:lysophospholipase L1-like esterase